MLLFRKIASACRRTTAMNQKYFRWLCIFAGAFSFALFTIPVRATTLYGSLSNFDVINDTGQTAHGFEIELDGLPTLEYLFNIRQPQQSLWHSIDHDRWREYLRALRGHVLRWRVVLSNDITRTNQSADRCYRRVVQLRRPCGPSARAINCTSACRLDI